MIIEKDEGSSIMSIVLKPNESVIWSDDIKRGFWKPKTVQRLIISNQRVMIQDHDNTYPSAQLDVKDLDDAVVINRSHLSNSSFMGSSTLEPRYRFMYGQSRSKGIALGDVVFMHDGKPIIIFNGIADPNGVIKLVKSAQRQLFSKLDK